MSKILIYAINVYNLHVRTASFPDPEKLLKSRQWLDMRLMNVNTKFPEMKYNPYTKYGMIYRPVFTIYRLEK